jgi:hypothetical protein
MASLRVSPAEVARAAHVIDANDAVGKLRQALALANQGRPRALSLRAFLIGGLLAVQHLGSFKASTIHKVLTEGLSYPDQVALGVRYRRGNATQLIRLDHVYSWTKMLTKRLTYTDHGAADCDEQERERRRTAFWEFIDALVDGSLVDAGGGWYALDGTAVEAWGRPPRGARQVQDVRAGAGTPDEDGEQVSDETTAETEETNGAASSLETPEQAPAPDADLEAPDGRGESGEQDGDNQPTRQRVPYDLDAAHGYLTAPVGGRDRFFGYMLDAAVRISPPGDKVERPVVAERFRLTPASSDLIEPSLQLIDGIEAKATAITDLCIDRHYSYKKTEYWARELQDRSIRQHLDLRSDEQGFRDSNGMRMVAGWMHCPATPDEYADIPRPASNASEEARAEFLDKIHKRLKFAMGRVERTNAGGRSRWKCPALDGRVGCPLRDGSVEIAKQQGLPIVQDPPALATAPSCCTNTSGVASVRDPRVLKHEQANYWGTEKWQAAYNRRSYVEGYFGSLKNHDTEDIRRGFTKFVGLPLNALGLAFGIIACNIRHQRKWWAKRTDRPDHLLLADDDAVSGWIEVSDDEVALLAAHRHAAAQTTTAIAEVA